MMKLIVNVLVVVVLIVIVVMIVLVFEFKYIFKLGWIMEQFYEYFFLNIIEGLEGMVNVIYYEVIEFGEVIDFGVLNFEKCDGSRDF